jgi:hypothetical protein
MRREGGTAAGAGDKAPRGDERPDGLEQEEAPLRLEVRLDGEDSRTYQVEEQVGVRFLVKEAELDTGEGRQDHEGAGNLEELEHGMVRPV